MVIYMDDYRKAQAMNVAAYRRYDDELLCVNWNPAIGFDGCELVFIAHSPSPVVPNSTGVLM